MFGRCLLFAVRCSIHVGVKVCCWLAMFVVVVCSCGLSVWLFVVSCLRFVVYCLLDVVWCFVRVVRSLVVD